MEKDKKKKGSGPLAAVSNLEMEVTSHDCVTLKWSNGAGEDSVVRYKVGYTRVGYSECVRYVHVDNTSCIVDCLSPGTEYKFFVIACNEHGKSDRSKEVNGKTLELPTNWIELWVRRPGLIMAVIFLAFGVQYLFFGNIDNNKNLPDVIRDMEGRLEDYDMTISTLKQQHINEKGIFNDMVEKFKKEMKNITKTKLKELTNKVESASNDASSANEKLNDLEKAKKTLEDKYKDIEETFQRKIMNMESTFNDTISAVNNSVEKFEQTFSKHEESLEAFERKINRKMQEMTKAFEEKSAKIKEQVEDFSKDFDKKLKKFKEAKSDLDEILFAVRKDVDTIKPNTFNKGKLEQPPIAFYAHHLRDLLPDTDKILIFEKTFTNEGTGYDTSTGIFTAPVGGLYQFDVHTCNYKGKHAYLGLVMEGNVIAADANYGDESYGCNTFGAIMRVKLGEKVWVKSTSSGSTRKLYQDTYRMNTFSGMLVIN